MSSNPSFQLLRLLATRLERLSADSRWARRASGLRGSLLKVLDEPGFDKIAPERLNLLIDRSFEILKAAAHEIPDTERCSNRSKEGH